jgi:hypothetical protein
MTLTIDRAVIGKQFGSADALAEAVAAYQAACDAHAATEGVPAPSALPLVEAIVRDHGGAFAVAEVEAGDPPSAERAALPKSLIVKRLNDGGLLAAAKAALDADLYARERWYAADRPVIYRDDPEALALIAAIGADVEMVMAAA